MEKWIVFKCHIDRYRLIYVTSFDEEHKAERFVDSKNRRPINPDNPDTMFNYYYMKNIWYECVKEE